MRIAPGGSAAAISPFKSVWRHPFRHSRPIKPGGGYARTRLVPVNLVVCITGTRTVGSRSPSSLANHCREGQIMVAIRINDPLTADQLRAVLDYDPATVIFTWRDRPDIRPSANAMRRGTVAGTTNSKHGYIAICIHGRLYLGHRLAWLYVYGRWPAEEIDHINEVRTDNGIANLRESTHRQNNTRSKARKDNNERRPRRLQLRQTLASIRSCTSVLEVLISASMPRSKKSQNRPRRGRAQTPRRVPPHLLPHRCSTIRLLPVLHRRQNVLQTWFAGPRTSRPPRDTACGSQRRLHP